MGYPTRRFITVGERQKIFDRWFAGESQHSIARSLGRGHASIQGVLSRTGGIRPRPRKRAERALSLAEREEISRGVAAGQSLRCIAAALDRAPSTVSREINRNSPRQIGSQLITCQLSQRIDSAKCRVIYKGIYHHGPAERWGPSVRPLPPRSCWV